MPLVGKVAGLLMGRSSSLLRELISQLFGGTDDDFVNMRLESEIFGKSPITGT